MIPGWTGSRRPSLAPDGNTAIEKATRASKTMTVNGATVFADLLLALDRAARETEEDESIDAEDILAQAEEANALDPVG